MVASSVSSAAVSCTLEEMLESKEKEMYQQQWVQNAPDPPCFFREVFENVKDTILPPNNSKNVWSTLVVNDNQQPLYKRVLVLLTEIFPILASLRGYNAHKFKFDLMAGITVASLAIPQCVGFATLAQLSPEYGLYTCFGPPLMYAMLTSSREIVIGNVAVDSLLLSSMISKLKDPIQDSVAYTQLLLTATFIAGIFQLAFGIFRFGFLVDYLSHATIVGFLAAAAVGIGAYQFIVLLGIKKFTNKSDLISVIKIFWTSLFKDRSQWHPYSFTLGFSFLCFILFARFMGRRNKKLFWLPTIAPLLSVIVSSIVAYTVNSHQINVKDYKVDVLGEIKGGSLNPISLLHLNLSDNFLAPLIKTGLTVAVISLTETIAVGRSFASLRGYNLDPNKEMISLGLTNIVGSFTSCYVASGSLSRTALNYSSGAETTVSSIVMALTVLISLKFLTRLLYYTPKAILAAIIISVVPGLIDVQKAYQIWKVDKLDFLACAAAFFGVLFASVEMGLAIAVTISFAKLILVSIQPGITVLGRLPGKDAFGDIEQYPMGLSIPGLLILSPKSSFLCFANATLVRERIERWVNDGHVEEGEGGSNLKFIILDSSGLTNIDTAGIASLEELNKNLISHGVKLVIANPRWQVIHKLRVGDFVSKIGGRVFVSVGEAVDACLGLGAAKMANTV
ncbi:early nodulin-70-like [Arachis duranensis]|uniref:Early nodulin-70-like n=1 Tax=Arachis duranensis TaxID=130453 RepID=A0A6P4C5E0_ARADU|nr:early nodulin-70-like [Arachis duranensis]